MFNKNNGNIKPSLNRNAGSVTCYNCQEKGRKIFECPHPQKKKTTTTLLIYGVKQEEEDGHHAFMNDEQPTGSENHDSDNGGSKSAHLFLYNDTHHYGETRPSKHTPWSPFHHRNHHNPSCHLHTDCENIIKKETKD